MKTIKNYSLDQLEQWFVELPNEEKENKSVICIITDAEAQLTQSFIAGNEDNILESIVAFLLKDEQLKDIFANALDIAEEIQEKVKNAELNISFEEINLEQNTKYKS